MKLWHRATVNALDEQEGAAAADKEEARASVKAATGLEVPEVPEDDDGDYGSVLAKFVGRKRFRNYIDVLWPVLYAYGETLADALEWCSVLILLFDGVFLGLDEVLKIMVWAPEAQLGGHLPDQVLRGTAMSYT
jgi:hypothetical protein